MKYIYAECLETGEVFATPIKYWRTALKCLNLRLDKKLNSTTVLLDVIKLGNIESSKFNISIADENFKGWRS